MAFGEDRCASFFKIKRNMFLDTLIQTRSFWTMKINNFLGELTDVLAKKEALIATWFLDKYIENILNLTLQRKVLVVTAH